MLTFFFISHFSFNKASHNHTRCQLESTNQRRGLCVLSLCNSTLYNICALQLYTSSLHIKLDTCGLIGWPMMSNPVGDIHHIKVEL